MNRIHYTAILASAALAVSIPGILNAQDRAEQRGQDRSGRVVIEGQQEGQAGEPMMLSEEKLQMWFEHAASGNQYEIQAAELAKERIQEPRVQQMADMLMRDHQMANDMLREQAETAGVTISDTPELTPVYQAKLDELEEKEGEEFTTAYVFGLDAGHRMTILHCNWAKNNVTNPEVLAYIDATLPKIEGHHQKIHQHANMLAGMEPDARPAAGDMKDMDHGDMEDGMDDDREERGNMGGNSGGGTGGGN